MKIFKIILTAAILLLSSTLAFGQTKPEKFDGIVIFSNPMPLPLGHYIELANPNVAFSCSGPNAYGEGETTFYFEFKIKRHTPNLSIPLFTIADSNISNLTNSGSGKLKFKHDLNAIDILCRAMRSTDIDSVCVPFKQMSSIRTSLDCQELRKDLIGREFSFQNSSILIEVPQSRINITGVDANNLHPSKKAQIIVDGRDNKIKIWLKLDIIAKAKVKDRYISFVTIRTTNDKFEVCFKNVVGANKWEYGNSGIESHHYINLNDLDELLSSEVIIDIVNEPYTI